MKAKVMVLLVERKFGELRGLLIDMPAADIAALIAEFPNELLPILFRVLPKELAAETFVEMEPNIQQNLIEAFSDMELKAVFDQLFLDDTVDIIEEMPANVVNRILRNSSHSTRTAINEALQYPKDSAGSIMTIEYVDLKADMTVGQAFATIRRTALDKETIYTCYVVDNARKLIGVISAKTLMLADQDQLVGDLMETNVISGLTTDSKEDVVGQIRKYDFLALPIVDTEHRLVGIVTVDDAIDVITEEAERDFAIMAATSPLENSYFSTSVLTHTRKRIIWLLVLMISATFTGMIISHYEVAVAGLPILVSFIPMLMDTGGNSGSQTSTLVIRGLATSEIRPRDIFKVLFKELRVSALIGLALALVNSVRMFILYHGEEQILMLILTTGITLFFVVVLAKCLGCCLPILAKVLHLDPAIMSSPMLTTICDACAVSLFFWIATRLLHIPVM